MTYLCWSGSVRTHTPLGTAILPGWCDCVMNATAMDSYSGYGIISSKTTTHSRGVPASVANRLGAHTTVPRSGVGYFEFRIGCRSP